MSRQFDDFYDDFPRDIPYGTKEFERYGVRYKALDSQSCYYVTSEGDVISYMNGDPLVLKTWTNTYGHKYTRIRINGKLETISVHREVAKAFIPNTRNNSLVRHLDDDPSNNCYENLAWGEQKDNMEDMRKHGRMFLKPVLCNETGRIYSSCASAADALGVSRSAVTVCCQGKIKTLKGFHFNYYDGEDGI